MARDRNHPSQRIAIATRVRGPWLEQVCLSGGTFNNSYLLEHLSSRLRAERFEVFTQSEVPAGDGGLCLGQAVVAAHNLGAADSKKMKRDAQPHPYLALN